jgi:hypothetical protein
MPVFKKQSIIVFLKEHIEHGIYSRGLKSYVAKSRILTTDYKAKTNKIRDFAYGRYGMRKLGFFQQK